MFLSIIIWANNNRRPSRNKTGLPIAYASIGLENDSTGTISNLNGNFKYTFNSNSNKFIKVTHVSYMTKLLPYSTYSDRHKLTIELTDKM